MMELLVSVLIIAIGVLGVFALQSTSLRANNGAYLRTQASYVASDIISRMMANPDGVDASGYVAIDSTSPPSDPSCITTGCTATQLADQDAREWSQYFSNVLGVTNFRETLPGGSGSVNATGNLYVVTINWTENTESGPEVQTLTVQTRL